MDSRTLHTEYLQDGTAGYAIIRTFYSRYSDVLTISSLIDINDVIHEVFLSLSKTNFESVRDPEHYIMRAIKLQCWSLLDKAIKQKAIVVKNEGNREGDKNERNLEHQLFASHNEQLEEIEGTELLVQISLFKNQLKENDIQLLNFLIDDTERSEIAKILEINLNTLDTNIRRLRIKLADYLRSLGYAYKGLERFN
ncbi:MAG TPA: hypothetical protein DCQ28_11765 [Bacteroidetes bacterium]|nr:hypothetical protein [Bacteroidota bacterium]